jgi:hypothetical protein
MELSLGTGQEVNIHNVKSVSLDKTQSLYKDHEPSKKYFRTMIIETEDGSSIEINLYSKDAKVLEPQD